MCKKLRFSEGFLKRRPATDKPIHIYKKINNILHISQPPFSNLRRFHGSPPALLKDMMHTISGSTTSGCQWLPNVKKLYLLAAIFVGGMLFSRPALGQQLVDAPEPKLIAATVEAASTTSTASPIVIQRKRPATHEFFDHQNIISFSAAAAMRAADSAYTCAVGVGTTTRNADGSITVRHEDFMAVNSCHGVVLMNSAFTGAGLGGSYLLHKMGHHKLERLPNWIAASLPALGIAYTATHQHLHATAAPGK